MSQRWIVRQALLPILLLAGAAASLVYGAIYHSVPVERNVLDVQIVQQEHEEERELPFAAPPAAGPDLSGSIGPTDPFFPPGPRPKVKVTVTEEVKQNVVKPVVEDERETTIVFEVTRGGVVLAESGVLRQTYGPTEAGDDVPPPSRCPT
jgi:hypothetical protein